MTKPFRIAFGAYIAVRFASLVPYAAELFSREGMMSRHASPIARVLPNVLGFFDAPMVALALTACAAVAGVFIALGRHVRVAALVALYALVCHLVRNPLILNPAMPYVGLMLACVAASRGSGEGRFAADDHDLRTVMFVLMALGYTYSGYTKLSSPSWHDGTAFTHVLDNPLARPTFLRAWLCSLPEGVIAAFSYGAVALELAFAPLALFTRTRPFVFFALVLMHVSLLVLIDFADLTLGMLLLHAYTFDPRWLPRRGAHSRTATWFERAEIVPALPTNASRTFVPGAGGFCSGMDAWQRPGELKSPTSLAPTEATAKRP